MKRALLTAALGLLALAASAQTTERTLRAYSGGEVSWEKALGQMDSIKFDGQNVLFHYDGGSVKVKPADALDSITFGKSDEGGSHFSSDTAEVRTDSIVRITFSATAVSVDNPFADAGVSVSVEGTDVSVTSTADVADITYLASGSCDAGSLAISTQRKLIIVLDNLTLTNPSGPALQVTGDKRATLHLEGESTLADGTASSGKGAVQSDGRFEIQGSGILNVTGHAKHGLQSSGATSMLGGTLNVLGAAKDGMNVDNFVMYGGTVSVSGTGGDCIDADQGYIQISGGTLQLASPADGAKGLACDSTLTISGGTIGITLTGTDTKGLRAGGTLSILGGRTTVSMSGSSSVYTNDEGELDSYKPIGIKAKAAFRFGGGYLNIRSTGHNISADGDISIDASASDSIVLSNSGTGFVYSGSGSSATDGFAPACLKSDGAISVLGGTLNATATGKGGRGMVADGRITVGRSGDADNLIAISIKTSGAAVNASGGSQGGWGGPGGPGGSSSDYWKGLPKGVKAKDDIIINSGHLQSFCAQTSGNPTGEAIESKDTLIINGGYVEANAYDDAINAASYIEVNGGHVWAYARGNDGIDCNGNYIRFNGGTIIAFGTECGIDDNADNGGTHLYITGATVVCGGGNMGAIEGTPSCTGQKYLTLSSSGGGWGGGSGLTTLTNGFCIKTSDGTEVLTFKMASVSSGNSGFESSTLNATAPAASGDADEPLIEAKRVSGTFVTSPDIQSGSYRYYTSPSISGGTSWHGLYSGATVTTSGSGSSATAR